MALVRSLPIVLLSLLVTACASVQLTDTWKAPELKELQFKKVVAVAIAPRREQRLAAEEEMVEELNSHVPESQSLHRLMPDLSLDDIERTKQVLREEGFDGAIVVRVVSGDSRYRLQYSEGQSEFRGVEGLLNEDIPAQPIALESELVRLETVIYSLKEDRLLWTSMSTAMDAASVSSVIRDLAAQVRIELQNEGLL